VTGLTCLELCAGGGGQALGLERAGFSHAALIEIDRDCCDTLHANRLHWPVIQADITAPLVHVWNGVSLVAAGLPCTPHSRGGRQLGEADERHLWDAVLVIVAANRPRAVILETSNAILSERFGAERARTLHTLNALGYIPFWGEIDCSAFGVPQRRRRAVLAAFLGGHAAAAFDWPEPVLRYPNTVGDDLLPLAAANGWKGVITWSARARDLAPTVVGGSRKHGGADLGASQGKAAWRKLGIDPMGIADGPPGPDGKYPRGRGITRDAGETGLMLTVEMAARLQGFPADWGFCGGKTSRYRQVGNALPPPVAEAIGRAIAAALHTL